jgi:hypothetical protein
MLQNHDYNLLESITVIAKSIYRYDTYMKDLDKVKCETCRKIWHEFHEQRQKELAVLLKELHAHVEGGLMTIEKP